MEKVLIIDDDDEFRIMLSDMLKRKGYAVICASNGEEGVALCELFKPKLAIVDLVMPKGGITNIETISSQFPDIKILVVSGGYSSSEEYLTITKDIPGVQAVFSKPFSHEVLVKKIETILVPIPNNG